VFAYKRVKKIINYIALPFLPIIHDTMVYKVAGKEIAYIHRSRSQSCPPDISLAAFGRKEIEIAEVSVSPLLLPFPTVSADGTDRMRCPVSST